MKKKLTAAVGVLLFLALLMLAIWIPSANNMQNVWKGYANQTHPLSADNMINWQKTNDDYTSAEDPQILIQDVDCYVSTVKIPGQLTTGLAPTVKVFYTTVADEAFAEKQSMDATWGVYGSNTYIFIEKEVASLRLDLTENSGFSLRADHVEINDRTPIIGITAICKYCIFPMLLLSVVAALILFRKSIKPYFLKLKKYIPLLNNLVSRDLKVKYRRSVLGFLWSVLNPLLMALVINTVFSRMFRFEVEYFAVYYLAGSLIFNFVIECTTGSMTSILDASALIKKVYIPKYIFPMEKCCFAFVNMLFGSVAVIVVMLIQGTPFSWTALLFPIPMVYAFIFAYGLSLVLSSFMVFFRDMQHLYSVWTMIWMYLTPIIYPAELLINNKLGFVMKVNPMYYYTQYLRDLIMYNRIPSLNENIICFCFAGVMLVFGMAIFKKSQDKFILYI